MEKLDFLLKKILIFNKGKVKNILKNENENEKRL
jgi:hypothetical protein